MTTIINKDLDRQRSSFSGLQNQLVRYQNLLLFLFFATGYFLWRYINFNYLVWDDTSSASFNIFANNLYYSLAKENFIGWMLRDVFGNIQGDGYRPFIAFVKRMGIGYFIDPGKSTVGFILFNSIINGLLAIIYFHFSKRFVQTRLAALFAVFLLFFSTPVLTAGLIVYSGYHCIIPLIVCSGLLCYYNFVEQGRYKFLWFAGLLATMLLGPLFREFIAIVPLLIIALEFQRLRRATWMMGLASIFFLHALFPTALVKWTLFHNIPIRPVFAMGNLGAYLQTGIEGRGFLHIIRNLHWRIFVDIISIYPTTIFVLVLLAIAIKRKMYKDRPLFGSNTKFLLIFFLLSFLPFLKAFNEQVHLAYCMVPASILLVKALEDLWFMIAKWKRFIKISKVVFIALIIMISADHSLNAYAVRKVTGDIYEGITKSADWFLQNVPKGTPVITNAHHLEDVRFYSRGHIEPWGAPGGIPDQRRWMHNTSDLQKLLDESGERDVYFFDVRIKETPGQRGLGRVLFYVRDKNVEMEDLGILHTTQSRYPFLDPLKHLIPMGQMTWPGPPDLEFDFYRGPALDGTPFHREVYAAYHLYRVTGDNVVGTSGFPTLVEENYYGFNIVSFRNRIYAIPQPEGAFELERVERGDYSRSFQGESVSQVKSAINRALGIGEFAQAKEEPPKLIEENYHGFNIVSFQNRIYAIPQPEGAFELERVEKGGYSRSFQGDSVAEIKEKINKALVIRTAEASQAKEEPPRLIEESYYGFNLVLYRNRIYAIPQPEGAFELERVEKRDYSRSFQGDNVEEVKQAINDAYYAGKMKEERASEFPPRLIEENYYGFNLVLYRNRIYAIPQPEGAFELERVEKGDYSRSFQGDSVGEVKEAIRQAYKQDKTKVEKGSEPQP